STHMTGTLNSSDVSQALKNMGLPANLSSHHGQANMTLSWPGAPYQPVLPQLNGNISLQLNDGMIAGLTESTNAKVGFGRLLTSLSLQNLPDRLSASFSNPGQHGFNFTSITGQFQLQNGNATIRQGALTSSIAAISVTGSINLANQTYNMTMVIVPHLTSSVPVAATLVGGPIVGVVAWAANKILSPAVNAISQDQYKVTGNWANPVITKI
ncbi:MAG: AsmA-like C-terminal region-containing protein, partial [Gammaproteobacteria bacterium]